MRENFLLNLSSDAKFGQVKYIDDLPHNISALLELGFWFNSHFFGKKYVKIIVC